MKSSYLVDCSVFCDLPGYCFYKSTVHIFSIKYLVWLWKLHLSAYRLADGPRGRLSDFPKEKEIKILQITKMYKTTINKEQTFAQTALPHGAQLTESSPATVHSDVCDDCDVR
jgi:hypothetical protein